MKAVAHKRRLATLLAIGLMASLVVYGSASGSMAEPTRVAPDREAPLPRTARANEAEALITRANLGGRVEAVLGDAFGGVWFEPATAQMTVGVTSAASARLVETVAARAGLSELVTEVPVASTWAQLDLAHERWDRRLADLFQRAEVATALLPDRNAVSIELGSAVPDSKREALERAAAKDSVAVSIVVASHPHLGLKPLARCLGFTEGLAHCDPTIVSGTSISGPWVIPKEEEAEEEEGGVTGELEEKETEEKPKPVRTRCTAGPPAILKNAAKKADETKTFILTAGHCVNEKFNGGGVKGGKWIGFNKKEEEKPIGEAVAYIFSETDIGVIEVTTEYWATAKVLNPVTPAIASWKELETDPFPIMEQKKPMVGNKTCNSGQTSGTNCGGEIVTTDQTINARGATIKNLIEVKGSKATYGDSGGPWFAEQAYKQVPSLGYPEGTTVGKKGSTGNLLFQALETSFEKLKNEKALDLELLTVNNEKRHGKFKAGLYPATIHGTTAVPQKFITEAGTIECKESTYHAVLVEPSSTLAVTPTYAACTASFGSPATVTTEKCTYVFHVIEKVSTDNYKAATDLCPVGSIKFSAGTCKAEIKTQSERETVDLSDVTGAFPQKDITVRPTLEGLSYVVTQDGFLCPFNGTGEKTGGQLTASEGFTVTGQSTSEATKKLPIEVADE
jgi:hypothetical protein